jgi:hypothetical protein
MVTVVQTSSKPTLFHFIKKINAHLCDSHQYVSALKDSSSGRTDTFSQPDP